MKNKNLIAISGKKGSGKDTIAEIIRQLLWVKKTEGDIEIYNEEDFNILKQSGQYTLHLKTNSGYEVKRFADKLKDMVCMLIGCTREQLEDRKFKEKELGEEWWQYGLVREGCRRPILYPSEKEAIEKQLKVFKNSTLYINKPTPRKILQLVGTESGRNIIHPNIWVNSLFADYDDDNWIIPDMRFPNELKAIEDRNGITIRVSRTGLDTSTKEDLYPSETALDDATFDYFIDNSGTISELIEKVKIVLTKEKIL